MKFLIYTNSMTKKTEFKINKYSLSALGAKSKVYTYLYNVFTKVYIKIENGQMTFSLCGPRGRVQTVVPIEYEGDTTYFSVDYSKWNIAFQKFQYSESVIFNVTKNLLKFKTDGSNDAISLSISTYTSDSPEADDVDNYINLRAKSILGQNTCLTLTEELLYNFNLADNLFVAQGRVNSIGVAANEVLYCDRSAVVKMSLEEVIDKNFFKNCDSDTDYVYIHSVLLKLFPLLAKSNTSVYFSDDYSVIYWSDVDTKIVLQTEENVLTIPTNEEFESIKPIAGTGEFELHIHDLTSALRFFEGFYEAKAWKPITFNAKKDEEITLSYSHPTSEINKTLVGVVSNYDGLFKVDSETLMKVLSKVSNRLDADKTSMSIRYDDDGPGVYIKIEDIYEIILSKLDEE